MARLAAFFRTSRADQRLLILAALLHVAVAIAVRVLPFGLVRRALGIAAPGTGRRPVDDAEADDAEARVIWAVRTVAFALPGATCLTEALVAQCLLAGYACETTLCFGVSRVTPAERPFDAHAWLERRGAIVIGASAIAYDSLHSRHSRCGFSAFPR